jgi:hypothetical protein
VGFVVDKAALGQVFSDYPVCLTHNYPSTGAGTIGQTVADVASGLSLAPPQRNKKSCIVINFPIEAFRTFKRHAGSELNDA